MAQYARPDSDISATNWTGSYTAIDEVTPSDTDYITGSQAANGTWEGGLSDVNTPATTSVTVRYRVRKEPSGGFQRGVTVALYQGTTLIGSHSTSDLTDTWSQYSGTIDASSVTDWTALRVRLTSTGQTGNPKIERAIGLFLLG